MILVKIIQLSSVTRALFVNRLLIFLVLSLHSLSVLSPLSFLPPPNSFRLDPQPASSDAVLGQAGSFVLRLSLVCETTRRIITSVSARILSSLAIGLCKASPPPFLSPPLPATIAFLLLPRQVVTLSSSFVTGAKRRCRALSAQLSTFSITSSAHSSLIREQG